MMALSEDPTQPRDDDAWNNADWDAALAQPATDTPGEPHTLDHGPLAILQRAFPEVDPGVRRSVLDLEGGNLPAAIAVLHLQLQELDLHVARPDPKPVASVRPAPTPGVSVRPAVEEPVTGLPPADASSLVPNLASPALAPLPVPIKLPGSCAGRQGTQLTEGPPPLGAAPVPVPIRLGDCAASQGGQPTEGPPPLGAVVTLPLPLPSKTAASQGAQPVQGAQPPGGSSSFPVQALAIPAPLPVPVPSKLYGRADEMNPPAFPLEPSSYLDSAASTPRPPSPHTWDSATDTELVGSSADSPGSLKDRRDRSTALTGESACPAEAAWHRNQHIYKVEREEEQRLYQVHKKCQELAAKHGAQGEPDLAEESRQKAQEYKRLLEEDRAAAARRIAMRVNGSGTPNLIEEDLHGLHVQDVRAKVALHISILPGLFSREAEVTYITGKGCHSGDGGAKIRPALVAALEEANIPYRTQPGRVVATYKPV